LGKDYRVGKFYMEREHGHTQKLSCKTWNVEWNGMWNGTWNGMWNRMASDLPRVRVVRTRIHI